MRTKIFAKNVYMLSGVGHSGGNSLGQAENGPYDDVSIKSDVSFKKYCRSVSGLLRYPQIFASFRVRAFLFINVEDFPLST
jgi:hypothetical protein